MKQALAILVVIAFVAALSSAAVFAPTQDTFLRYTQNDPYPYNGGVDQQWYQYGNNNQYRAGKGYQDQFIMDFDRTAILADASAQLGHTATAADFTSGAVTMTVSIMGSTTATTDMFWPSYFTSTTQAIFGVTGALNQASYNAAQNNGGVGIVKWNNGVDQGNAPDHSNRWPGQGTRMDCPMYIDNYAGGAKTGGVFMNPVYTYTDFAYPGDLAAGYLFCSGTNPYLELYGTTGNSPGYCYSMEQAGAGPKLAITPEPCSMLLIAAGAVVTLVRRRK
jgi:hypothetical protein